MIRPGITLAEDEGCPRCYGTGTVPMGRDYVPCDCCGGNGQVTLIEALRWQTTVPGFTEVQSLSRGDAR